ncbi:MAG: DEAD/DEAH box helicase [bacterium]
MRRHRQKDGIKTATIVKGNLQVKFPPYDLMMTRLISKINGSLYNHSKGTYKVPLKRTNVQKLEDNGFKFSRVLKKWIEQDNQIVKEKKKTIVKDIPGLPHSLFSYQKVAVKFVEDNDGRALIADEMGLGKTVEALAWTQLHPNRRPVLIICPSSLKVNWERETKKWVPDADVQVLEGLQPYELTGNFIIINYAILRGWVKQLKQYGFKISIVDEIHYIKTTSAKRTKAAKKIFNRIPYILALTGTPVEKDPIEIYYIANIIDPSLFPNELHFKSNYCVTKRSHFSGKKEIIGSKNEKKLNKILRESIMIRRKKDEVTDLPAKNTAVIPIPINNKMEYLTAEEELISYLHTKYDSGKDEVTIRKELLDYAKRTKIKIDNLDSLSDADYDKIKDIKLEKAESAKPLLRLLELQKLAVDGKMDEVVQWIRDFLKSGEKLVVFAINVRVIERLIKEFPKAVRVDGSVTGKKRQSAVDRFQNDKDCQLFIGNIIAAGVGLTLTAASNVAVIQHLWNPMKTEQAIDRVHRITQTKKVTIWKFVAENTIEEHILSIANQRKSMVDKILDGVFQKEVSTLQELINIYKNK